MRDNSFDTFYSAAFEALAESGEIQDYDVMLTIAARAKEIASANLREISLSTYAYPLMDTVAAMSLIGLADLSESLIGIQAAATYSKSGAATVGGFVEVVTIDRQYGIRWRKRLGD
jgi:hypothetical protein